MSKFIEIECVSMSSDKTSITINFRSSNELYIKNDKTLYIIRRYKKIKEVLNEQDNL